MTTVKHKHYYSKALNDYSKTQIWLQ